MNMHFCLIRENFTSTSVNLDVDKIDYVRRWIVSSIRNSSTDASKYHFVAYGGLQDISGTDRLEELTGSITGTVFKIINKREFSNDHMEFDLEKICQTR